MACAVGIRGKMARIARVVVPGMPHHITQRGNRRQQTFFLESDYALYLDLMADWCRHCKVEIWSYCLMPNHVHLVAVPKSADGLRRAIGEAHRRYTRHVNFREGWRGHLWQGRFASFVMDEAYLLAAARYIERNPLRARLVSKPGDYAWSSAGAHLKGKDDGLVKVAPLRELISDWRSFLAAADTEEECMLLRKHEKTGRPLETLALSSVWRRKWIAFFAGKSPGQNPRRQTIPPSRVSEISKVSPELSSKVSPELSGIVLIGLQIGLVKTRGNPIAVAGGLRT